MKRALLFFTVSIPVTYDERLYTERQALDAVQKAAEDAIARACDGREVDISGKHTDCTGPRLVAPGSGPDGGEGR